MPPITLTIAAPEQGQRLDQVLAQRLGDYTRSRLQKWIKSGGVTVNDLTRPANYRVRAGDRLQVIIPAVQPSPLVPEAVPLDILYEDQDLLVLNKPAGLTVHPGAGCPRGTLVHALLHHCPDLGEVGDVARPGLVHRLDKDTSGVMVAAKTAAAHVALQRQFKARQVAKTYLALAWGRLPGPRGEIVQPIGRHPQQRHKMSVGARRGREAHTSWRLRQVYPGPLSLLEVTLHTGRTHQIRVHLAAAGHPVAGDQVYGGGARRLASVSLEVQPLASLVTRQLLHAWKLAFDHPRTGARLTLTAPLPADFQAALDFLEQLGPCSK